MKSIFKVPGGKLIKVELLLEYGKIKQIRITGDFFCYPEEKFALIEKSLSGENFTEESIQKNIQKTIEQENLRLIGLSSQDLAKTILLAQ